MGGGNPFQPLAQGVFNWIDGISLLIGAIALMFIGYRFYRGRMSMEDAFAWAIGSILVFGAIPITTAVKAWAQGI